MRVIHVWKHWREVSGRSQASGGMVQLEGGVTEMREASKLCCVHQSHSHINPLAARQFFLSECYLSFLSLTMFV